MKANANIGDFVFYNHHQLSLIVDQKVLLEIGYKIWDQNTNQYTKRFRMYSRINKNRDRSRKGFMAKS